MRLFAFLVMALITAYWGVSALYLLFLPEGTPGATAGVVIGAVLLVTAGLYALATWGVFTIRRGLHILAIVLTALGLLQPLASTASWVNWVLAVANLAALVLLALTIPRGKPKAATDAAG